MWMRECAWMCVGAVLCCAVPREKAVVRQARVTGNSIPGNPSYPRDWMDIADCRLAFPTVQKGPVRAHRSLVSVSRTFSSDMQPVITPVGTIIVAAVSSSTACGTWRIKSCVRVRGHPWWPFRWRPSFPFPGSQRSVSQSLSLPSSKNRKKPWVLVCVC